MAQFFDTKVNHKASFFFKLCSQNEQHDPEPLKYAIPPFSVFWNGGTKDEIKQAARK